LVLSRSHREGLRHCCFAHRTRFLSQFSVSIGRERHEKEFHEVFGTAAIVGCVLEAGFLCRFEPLFDASVRPLDAYGASDWRQAGGDTLKLRKLNDIFRPIGSVNAGLPKKAILELARGPAALSVNRLFFGRPLSPCFFSSGEKTPPPKLK
jgi:hypothetical protein